MYLFITLTFNALLHPSVYDLFLPSSLQSLLTPGLVFLRIASFGPLYFDQKTIPRITLKSSLACEAQHSWALRIKWVHARSLQSCLTLCEPMDCSLPGPSVHRIIQAGILEWVAMPSSRGSSHPRHQTQISYISCIGRCVFTTSATWEWAAISWLSFNKSSFPPALHLLEKEMATHSNILAWKIPWTEKPGRLQSMGL